MEKKIRLWLWLAGVNLFISAFTFGGGYIVVPMIRKYYVWEKKIFTEDELMEMAAISQSTPGAIAVNLASLAGYRAAGKPGLMISCVCAVLPPLIILTVISVFYTAVIANPLVSAVLRGMQAGVAALIVDFAAGMAVKMIRERSFPLIFLMVISFLLSCFTKLNLVFILLGSCLLCVIHARNQNKKGKEA